MNAMLIRHTRVVVPPNLCYGRSEVPLAATFDEEAEVVRVRLPWTPTLVLTSPAERCRRLAVRLGGGMVRVDGRLAELNFGVWEGRNWEMLNGPDLEAWMQAPWTARPPEGETAGELLQRVTEVRSEVLSNPVRNIAVVTHAGVIRAWRSLTEKRPLAALFQEPIGYGEIWEAE